MKENKSKDKTVFERILFIIRIILIIIIIVCLVYILLWCIENKKNSKILNDLTEASVIDTIVVELPNDDSSENDNEPIKITAYELDFDKLLPINSSTVGWLTVPNTSINYPVVKAGDNSFYLTHSFDKSNNGAGWIFADYRNKFDNTDKNIIIYGHNRMDSSMFATLSTTQKSYWYSNPNNKYITFATPTANHVYEVFSVYTIKAESYYIQTDFENDASYSDFLNTLKSRSIYDFNNTIDSSDQILTLSTCDSTGASRVVVHAKKIM